MLIRKLRMFALTIIPALALTVIPALTGCAGSDDPAVPQSQGTDTAVPSVDRAGNPISPPPEPKLIISLSPAVTQTLVHLGAADLLAAADTNSVKLEGVPEGLPSVDMLFPDTELLLTLNADLLLCSSMTGYDGSEPLKPLAAAGVCIAVIPSGTSMDDIREDLAFIAALTGRRDEGAAIREELDTGILAVRDALGGAKKKSVYFEIAAAPAAYSFGGGTFMNELIEIAGGENIFADLSGWLAVSEEQVIARDPDVIFTNIDYSPAPVDEILSRSSLRGVTAVVEKQVFFVDSNSSSLANEYVLTAVYQMAAAMHPDLWKNG